MFRFFSAFIALIAFVSAKKECQADEVYVQITKQNKKNANKEGFIIMNGDTMVAKSPVYSDNFLNITEFCITKSIDLQYKLKLISGGNTGWKAGSWMEIKSIYNNVIFRGYPLNQPEEIIRLSFKTLIDKKEVWKVAFGSAPDNWKNPDYDDSEWLDVDLSNPTIKTEGTQYFRKSFKGSKGFAAYEIRCNFQYGSIFYINGHEIYREHMLLGPVTSTTESTGKFYKPLFFGAVRNGREVENDTCVLAVELHFTAAANVTSINFDSFLSVYAANSVDSDHCTYNSCLDCFILGEQPSVMSLSRPDSGGKAFNYDKEDFWMGEFDAGRVALKLTYGDIRPTINGLRIYLDTNAFYGPSDFTLYGITNSQYTPLLHKSDMRYDMFQYSYVMGESSFSSYQYFLFDVESKIIYKMTIIEGNSSTVRVAEIHPAVCAIDLVENLTFDATSYQATIFGQPIRITPTILGFDQCTVTPKLPQGLSIDFHSCVISGVPETTLSDTIFTVHSAAERGFDGMFSLSVATCTETELEVERIYGSIFGYESFTLKSEVTGEVLWHDNVTDNSKPVTRRFCRPAGVFNVTVGGWQNFWGIGSYLNVRVVLDAVETKLVQRIRYDERLHLSHVWHVSTVMPIASSSQWHYKMGVIPEGWKTGDMIGWDIASSGTFPSSTNQIQLFKRTFTVASTATAAGFELYLRFRYGCVVYLNGLEAYRYGVTGDVTNTTFSEMAYKDVMYRTVTLPIVRFSGDDLLIQGDNLIVIALIAPMADKTECYFDAAIHLMDSSLSSRLLDFSYATIGISGDATACFDDYWSTVASSTPHMESNYAEVVFNDDKREFISAISITSSVSAYLPAPAQVQVWARNNRVDEWVRLDLFTGISYWGRGQEKILYVHNDQPWQQYQIRNIGGTTMQDAWTVNRIALYSAKIDVMTPVPFYEDITAHVAESLELFPSVVVGYSKFAINGTLPDGLIIDSATGVITGTPTAAFNVSKLTVKAMSQNGLMSEWQLVLEVKSCGIDETLISLKINVDSFPSLYAYKLYRGQGHDVVLLRNISDLLVPSSTYVNSFCLPEAEYTIELIALTASGWNFPNGFQLFANSMDFPFYYDYVAPYVRSPSVVTVQFSTVMPLREMYTLYKTRRGSAEKGWQQKDFNDTQWVNLPVSTIKDLSEGEHLYVRHSIAPFSSGNSSVMHLRLHYAADVTVFLNGDLVASAKADSDQRASFSLVGNYCNGAMLAMEFVGRTQTAFIFDANAVMSNTSMSRVIDTVTDIQSSPLLAGSAAGVFDSDPLTYAKPDYSTKSVFFSWSSVSNTGSIFNTYGITISRREKLSWTLYGRTTDIEEETWTLLDSKRAVTLYEKRVNEFASPVALSGFSRFFWNLTKVDLDSPVIAGFHMLFKEPTGYVCTTIDGFPSVQWGELSYRRCSQREMGYMSRPCKDGIMGEIDKSHCVAIPPRALHYDRQDYLFYSDEQVHITAPTYEGTIDVFAVEGSLPDGLVFDVATGEMTGEHVAPTNRTVVTVTGNGAGKTTSTMITVEVRGVWCYAMYSMPMSPIETVLEVSCRDINSQNGSLKYRCVGDAVTHTAKWEVIEGECTPKFTFGVWYILAVICVSILIVMGIVVVRMKIKKEKMNEKQPLL